MRRRPAIRHRSHPFVPETPPRHTCGKPVKRQLTIFSISFRGRRVLHRPGGAGIKAAATTPQPRVEQVPHGVAEHVQTVHDNCQAQPRPDRPDIFWLSFVPLEGTCYISSIIVAPAWTSTCVVTGKGGPHHPCLRLFTRTLLSNTDNWGIALRRSAGAVVRWDDVTLDPTDPAVVLRRTMERRFAPAPAHGSPGAVQSHDYGQGRPRRLLRRGRRRRVHRTHGARNGIGHGRLCGRSQRPDCRAICLRCVSLAMVVTHIICT